MMRQTKTDRRPYERPRMRVVELRQRPALLQASANATLNVTYEEEDW